MNKQEKYRLEKEIVELKADLVRQRRALLDEAERMGIDVWDMRLPDGSFAMTPILLMNTHLVAAEASIKGARSLSTLESSYLYQEPSPVVILASSTRRSSGRTTTLPASAE